MFEELSQKREKGPELYEEAIMTIRECTHTTIDHFYMPG